MTNFKMAFYQGMSEGLLEGHEKLAQFVYAARQMSYPPTMRQQQLSPQQQQQMMLMRQQQMMLMRRQQMMRMRQQQQPPNPLAGKPTTSMMGTVTQLGGVGALGAGVYTLAQGERAARGIRETAEAAGQKYKDVQGQLRSGFATHKTTAGPGAANYNALLDDFAEKGTGATPKLRGLHASKLKNFRRAGRLGMLGLGLYGVSRMFG